MADVFQSHLWQTLDFILCEGARLTVLLAIELDDRSHGTLERGLRDNLVDCALADAGIPILASPLDKLTRPHNFVIKSTHWSSEQNKVLMDEDRGPARAKADQSANKIHWTESFKEGVLRW